MDRERLIELIKNGGTAVIPTDTLYGLVASALSPSAVSRVYDIKGRDFEKPCILLLGQAEDTKKFGITPPKRADEYWPGPVSIILDCPDEKFSYLHRGTKTLAFRVPAPAELRALLLETGPLIAPSANPEGMPPAKNIKEAEKYFGNMADAYVDGGALEGKASRVIRLHNDGTVDLVRA